jgi:hypothetical protein
VSEVEAGVLETRRPGEMRTHARALAGAGVLLLVLGLAACGDDGGADDGSSTDTGEETADDTTTTEADAGSTTSTTEQLSPEEEVIRDYEAAYVAAATALNPPNPDSPELPAHFTGEALASHQSTIRSMQSGGAAADSIVEHRPSNVVITGETATLRDCFVDTTQMIDLTSGQPAGQPTVTTLHVDVELERVDGTWKVARRSERTDPCPPG